MFIDNIFVQYIIVYILPIPKNTTTLFPCVVSLVCHDNSECPEVD